MHQKICLLLLLTISQMCLAQDVTKDFRNKSISIFKNKTAFFVKSGKVKTDNKIYRITENLPPALFGSYWMLSPAGELSALSSYVDTLTKSKEEVVISFADMLKANMGKNIRLHLNDQNEVLQGTIMDVPKTSDKEWSDKVSPCFTMKEAGGKWITFHADQIKQIEFMEQPNQLYTTPTKEIKPVMQVDFTGSNKEQPLDMMYLAYGLSWTPVYLIELTDETKAKLTLRAEVVNDIEDIVNTDVNFVAGVPNFLDANRLSPLTNFPGIGVNMQQYTNHLNQMGNVQNYAYNTQTEARFHASDAVGYADENTLNNLEGSTEEDLFFYSLKNLSLQKGGRGHYPIFTAELDIAHIYECNLPINDLSKGYNNQYNNNNQDYLFSPNPNKVIHSIKITNDTKLPFTTGPALVVKKQGDTKPISQDKLNYTSVGGHTYVKLTESPDVQISHAEKIIKTEEQIKQMPHGYYYDRITMEGTIKIKNYKDKAIDLNVKRTIIGELQQSNFNWKTAERNVVYYHDFNKLTDVRWETKMKAGEELTIVYSYLVFLRR
jgi:hypothetical protein